MDRSRIGIVVLVVGTALFGTAMALRRAGQRLLTGGLVSSIVTHAIWSVSVFSVLPLR